MKPGCALVPGLGGEQLLRESLVGSSSFISILSRFLPGDTFRLLVYEFRLHFLIVFLFLVRDLGASGMADYRAP